MFLVAAMGSLVAAGSPHILWIILDDLGWNDVGWRDPQFKTPVIDFYASKGVILDQYYTQESCSPSRATFVTGRWPIHHGIIDWIPPSKAAGLPLRETTVADLLQRGGYETHAVGKWHLGFYREEMTPTFRGFNSFYGFYAGGQDYRSHVKGPGYDFHRDPEPRCNISCRQVADEAVGHYSTHLFSAEAARIVTEHDTVKPLFIYLAYQAPHAPLDVPAQYEDLYEGIITDPLRRTYAGMVSCVDEGIGNVTAALAAKGMLENTFIAFTTDNGGPTVSFADSIGSSNWPLRGGKHSIWEGGTRSIGFVWGPGLGVAQGVEYSGLMHGADWLPTLCEVAGVSATGTLPLDGVSQLSNFKDPSLQPARDSLVIGNTTTNGCQWDGRTSSQCGFAIREDRWKFIRGFGGFPAGWCNKTADSIDCGVPYGVEQERTHAGYSLYDIEADPSEVYDVAAQHPDRVAAMNAKVDVIMAAGYFHVLADPDCEEVVFDGRHPRTPPSGKIWAPWCSPPGTPTNGPTGFPSHFPTPPGGSPTLWPTELPKPPPTAWPTLWPATGYPSTGFPINNEHSEIPASPSPSPTRSPTALPTARPSPSSASPSSASPSQSSASPSQSSASPSQSSASPSQSSALPTSHPTGHPRTGFPWYRTGFPASGYPSTGFPSTGFPASGFPSSGFPSSSPTSAGAYTGVTGYPEHNTGYPRTGYPSSGFPSSGFPSTGYPSSGFPTAIPSTPTAFPRHTTGYPSAFPSNPTGYPRHTTGYPRTGYPSSGFPSTSPSTPTAFPRHTTGYPRSGYPSAFPSNPTGYPRHTTGYPRTGYPSSGYPSSGFPSSGFPSSESPTAGGSDSPSQPA